MGILGSLYRLPRKLLLAYLKRQGLKVGKNFYWGSGSVIDSTFCWLVEIGNDVTIADRVYILAHDASTKLHIGYTRVEKVVIGDRVFIGTGSIVLPGVTIGDNVIIGAGSVVTKNIPSHSLANGNPANITGTFNDYINKKREELDTYPCFGSEHLSKGKLTAHTRTQIMKNITDGKGYLY
jgi:maltose O-acetyltransferase